MLSINIKKLRSEVEAREQRKIKIYEYILELCYKRILNSNEKNNECSCTYIVPNVVFGLPLYDVNECVTFIINKLTEKEFDIAFAHPTTIHISWKPIDKNESYKSIQYETNNKYENNKNKQLSIAHNNYKIDNRLSNKSKDNSHSQNKNYKPIDEYSQSHLSIYDPDDINLFQNKLDNLFN